MSGSSCNPGEGSAGFLAEAGSWLHHFLGQDEVPLDLPLVFNRVYNSGPLPPWSGQLQATAGAAVGRWSARLGRAATACSCPQPDFRM